MFRAVKRTHRQLGPCSTSSLESCGVLSGPIASSGPSQFPSPSQVLASARQEPFGGKQGSVPSSATGRNPTRGVKSAHDDVGYMRIPVTNQVRYICNADVCGAVWVQSVVVRVQAVVCTFTLPQRSCHNITTSQLVEPPETA